jgi:hypothetical protein
MFSIDENTDWRLRGADGGSGKSRGSYEDVSFQPDLIAHLKIPSGLA